MPVGGNAFFSVTVGGPVLSFQWYFATSNVMAGASDLIADATNSLLTLTNVQLTNAGQFQVVVTNSTQAATSSVAVLTVSIITNFPPVITVQPVVLQTVEEGDAATLSVTATGAAPLMYQWQFQDSSFVFTNIFAATNPVLSIPNVQSHESGEYFVTVTNNFGSTNSSITRRCSWILPKWVGGCLPLKNAGGEIRASKFCGLG